MFSQDIADKICLEIATGSSLRKICKQEGMPCMATVFNWLADENNKSFLEQYTRAREAQADCYADQMFDIATECEADPAKINKARLEIDTIKWVASKLKPKKYGDKITHSGDEDAPMVYEDRTVKGKILSMLTEEQLRQIEANANT